MSRSFDDMRAELTRLQEELSELKLESSVAESQLSASEAELRGLGITNPEVELVELEARVQILDAALEEGIREVKACLQM